MVVAVRGRRESLPGRHGHLESGDAAADCSPVTRKRMASGPS
jgi:hypothetical protein